MLDQSDASITRRLNITFGLERIFGVRIHNINITGSNRAHLHGNKFYYLYVVCKEMK